MSCTVGHMSDLQIHDVSIVREKRLPVRAEMRLFTPKGTARIVDLSIDELAKLAEETTKALRILLRERTDD